MPGKPKVSSIRSQRKIDDVYRTSFEAVVSAIEAINQKLKDGHGLTDEEIRLIKKSHGILDAFKEREQEKELKTETGLPEGQLKEFVERAWVLREKYNIRSKEDFDNVMKQSYYTCDFCGEWHYIGSECPFKALKQNETLSDTSEEIDLTKP